jgi:hypothetical protein
MRYDWKTSKNGRVIIGVPNEQDSQPVTIKEAVIVALVCLAVLAVVGVLLYLEL